ncbi:MAG: hypothetical protein BWX96_00226 [Bacteroidetes bacterium ADurb.Bin145]|jgi:hypothetical protein|nr:MAG: hypothetical protein BWX96_00226 [Bacteroidetes bacterium ADurb.Bin145]
MYNKNNLNLTRNSFIKKIVRIVLLSVIAGIVFVLGGRISAGGSCRSCPGRGFCNGEEECNKYLPDRK